MKVVTPPDLLIIEAPAIFLAGSIEQDKAARWQDAVIEQLQHLPVTILNPRRAKWDASWNQSIDNEHFSEQVNWELDALEMADLILLYFDPNTRSPISLLELGLFAKSKKLLVCCPDGFWRKGNVDVVCRRYGIEQFESLEQMMREVMSNL